VDFLLPEELITFKNLAKKFAEKEIAPTVADDDEKHYFRRELVKKMGDLGFFGCLAPDKYGGNEAGYLAMVLMIEEISKVSASMSTPFNNQYAGAPSAILKWGTEEQKQKYLPELIKGEIISCFAITEPNTGSDVASISSTAIKDGDHYILNGNKTWITFAPVADISLVYVYTDLSQRHHGMSCFIVENDRPGFSTREITTKLGLRSIPTGEIIMEDCRVPAANMLGNAGDGFRICMSQLEGTRIGTTARGLGIAAACLKVSTEYAQQRKQFGQPIAEFQMIQDQLARMAVEEEAARLLLYKAAWSMDNYPDKRHTKEIAIAKYNTAEAAVHAANEAIKILGAYGYSEEYPVARYLRDSKALQLTEGSSNIQKILIAREILKSDL